jgi:cation:H+ antiporter
MIISFLLVIVGLALLIYAADLLVKGSASLSKRAGISSLVIGLTVVSFGTSAPELIVNIFSAIQGTTGISLGNIVGSNIANILLILGIGSLITTLKVQKSTTWKEIPFALLAAILLFTISNDVLFDSHSANVISRSEGIALMGFFMHLYITQFH